MDYKEFDKGCNNELIYNKIVELLKERPMTTEELIKKIGCTRNQLVPQRYKLVTGFLISKKRFNMKWYWGLNENKRTN